MKLKQVFRLLENANKINVICGNSEVSIVLDDDGHNCYRFATYKKYKTFVNDTYKPEVAERLLGLKLDFEFSVYVAFKTRFAKYALYFEANDKNLSNKG